MTPDTVFEISPEDEHELKRLLGLLECAEGFQLRAARCELPAATEAYIRWLESRLAEHGREIVTIDLTMNETEHLHEAIQAELEVRFTAELPSNLALMVMGLEWSIVLDDAESPAVLQNLCIERECAWQELPYPLVLWLPSYALKQLAKLDSDFSAWTECVYEFIQVDDSVTASDINQTDDKVHEVIRLLERFGTEFSAFGSGTEILEAVKPIYRNWSYRLGTAYQSLGQTAKAASLLSRALEIDDGLEGDWRYAARAHHAAGVMFWQTSQLDKAIYHFDRALSASQKQDDKYIEFTTLGNLGAIYSDLNSHDAAIEYYEAGLAISRELGDQQGEAVLLGNLGVVHDNRGELEMAIDSHQQALEISRSLAARAGEATHLGNLGGVYGKQGDWENAIRYFENALAVSREFGDRRGEGAWLGNLGATYSHIGDMVAAARCYHTALKRSREIGDRRNEALWLGKLSLTYQRMNQHQMVLACLHAVRQIGIAIGDRKVIEWAEVDTERLKAEVGAEAFAHLSLEIPVV